MGPTLAHSIPVEQLYANKSSALSDVSVEDVIEAAYAAQTATPETVSA